MDIEKEKFFKTLRARGTGLVQKLQWHASKASYTGDCIKSASGLIISYILFWDLQLIITIKKILIRSFLIIQSCDWMVLMM